MLGDGYDEVVPALGDLPVYVLKEVEEDFPTVAELCRTYWERERLASGAIGFPRTVEEIGRASGLSATVPSRMAGLASFVVLGGTTCPECLSERWAMHRTAYHDQVKAELGRAPCLTCQGLAERDVDRRLSGAEREDVTRTEGHLIDARHERTRQLEVASRRLRAVERVSAFDLSSPLPAVEELGLRDAVGFAALLRLGLSEDLETISPVSRSNGRLAPTMEMEIDVLAGMNERGIIAISPESDHSSFVFGTKEDETLHVSGYYTRDVCWSTKFEGDDEIDLLGAARRYIEDLEDYLDGTGEWPPLWTLLWEGDDWRGLWMEISLNECLAYLRLVLGEHGLPFRAGDKTRLVLEECLDRFSVAQVYGMIWRAGRDAAAFYMRRSSTREHAANTVVGSIQRYSERALSEGWELRSFRRDRRLPRSTTSEVFFAKALGAGDAGFDVPIPPSRVTLDSLPEWLSGEAR